MLKTMSGLTRRSRSGKIFVGLETNDFTEGGERPRYCVDRLFAVPLGEFVVGGKFILQTGKLPVFHRFLVGGRLVADESWLLWLLVVGEPDSSHRSLRKCVRWIHSDEYKTKHTSRNNYSAIQKIFFREIFSVWSLREKFSGLPFIDSSENQTLW
jgi:hypothetical protein